MLYRSILSSLFALAATSTLPAQSAAEARAKPQARLKALVIDGQNNHNWRQTTPLLSATLQHSGRFDVAVISSPADKEEFAAFAPKFSDYDVVVSNYNGQLWPKAAREAFSKYVREGGGGGEGQGGEMCERGGGAGV